MGTRGLIGFIMPDGTVKGTYSQFDMYPTGAGRALQQELQGITIPQLLPDAQKIRWVDESGSPTAEDLAHLKELGIEPQQVSTGKDWYAALRDNQGSMRKPLNTGIATDNGAFIEDSLFCEWAYLADFRSNEMVILEGFNTDPAKQAPYAKAKNADEYYGCREVFRGSLEMFLALDMDAFETSLSDA